MIKQKDTKEITTDDLKKIETQTLYYHFFTLIIFAIFDIV